MNLHILNKGCDIMTLRDYLANPFGKGSNVAPTNLIQDSLMEQFRNLRSSINVKYYKIREKSLVCHFKLPSRTKRGVTYDVVFEFSLADNPPTSTRSILNLDFQCFSNCPSFTYTYANAFEEMDLLCKWLKKKYERVVFRKDPKLRNPNKIMGYERSIYICGKYLAQDMATQGRIKGVYDRAVDASYSEIARHILDQDEVEAQYKRAPKIETNQDRRTNTATSNTKTPNTPSRYPRSNGSVSTVKSTKSVSKIETSKKHKPSFLSRIKRVKKI